MTQLSPAELKAGTKARINSGRYKILDKEGKVVPFRMNWAQEQLFDQMHFCNLILKARQLGMSTFIEIFLLDQAIHYPNRQIGIIAHNKDDAEKLFKTKIKFAYDHLGDDYRAVIGANTERAGEITFTNGSTIRVSTSFRSGTLNYLHVSEYGKICRKYPDKANEIRTGALNAVHPGQMVFIESTAEGREGHFYDMCMDAQRNHLNKITLTPMDYRFFFFPWWLHPEYQMPVGDLLFTEKDDEYFAGLESKHGVTITPQQRAWYVKKRQTQADEMLREFPSDPDEAFAAAIKGAYYATQMTKLRQDNRLTNVPIEPTIPVNTFWDLGMDDHTSIWFHQRVGLENRIVDFYSNNGEGLVHYFRVLQDKGYTFDRHFLPHDAAVKELGTGKSRVEVLESLGLRNVEIVSRQSVEDGIEATRNFLATCWIDSQRCEEGVKALDAYQREWDDKMGGFKSFPRHDWSSHAADALRYGALGFQPRTSGKTKISRRANWRTA